jgi:hypothetical protein
VYWETSILKFKELIKAPTMEKYTSLFTTPQKVAADLTDNPHLQDFLETFLSITNQEERQSFENKFWSKVTQFPSAEQAAIRASKERMSQRLSGQSSGSFSPPNMERATQ